MFPREPPGGSGASLQSLPADILKSCLWPLLSPEGKRWVRILNKHMRQQADVCIMSQTITIPAGPSHLPSLQDQLTKFPQVDGLILDCSEGATGLDVERLFRACSPSSGNIRTLMISFVSKEIQSWMSSALHSLPMSLRQTLVTLEMTRCCLDGSAFLTLGDCHNLTALNINDTKLTSLEAAESITCLTQLRSLDFHGYLLVDVPIMPFLSMPGLTELHIWYVSDVLPGSFCWDSPLMSVEDMRRRFVNRPSALRRLHIDRQLLGSSPSQPLCYTQICQHFWTADCVSFKMH